VAHGYAVHRLQLGICQCQLQPVTLADDIENKQILLQLAAANQVSKHRPSPRWVSTSTRIRTLSSTSKDLAAQAAEDAERRCSSKQMLEQQMQSTSMQAAGATGPGQGGAGGQQAAVTPGDIMSQADQIAQQLLAMPESQRRSELLKIKKSDETLHARPGQEQDGRSAASRLWDPSP
jgi:hypothetical protein